MWQRANQERSSVRLFSNHIRHLYHPHPKKTNNVFFIIKVCTNQLNLSNLYVAYLEFQECILAFSTILFFIYSSSIMVILWCFRNGRTQYRKTQDLRSLNLLMRGGKCFKNNFKVIFYTKNNVHFFHSPDIGRRCSLCKIRVFVFVCAFRMKAIGVI